MKHINNKIKFLRKHQLLLWMLYALANLSISVIENHGRLSLKIIQSNIINYPLGVIFFYVTLLFILPKYSNDINKLVLILLISIFIHNSIKYIILVRIYPLLFYQFKLPYTYWEAFTSATWWWFQFTVYATGFFMAKRAVQAEKSFRLSEEKNHSLAIRNLKLEYKFLRAQINPHFLYNVLGFFYGKVKQQDPKAGRGIELLTSMMRYSIREGEVDEKVNLSEELKAINNLLELQQLRFDDTTYIERNIDVRLDSLRIVPHILVTIVENACKHGDLTIENDPLHINAYREGDWFVFTTRNRLRTGKLLEVSSDGTGMVNLEERIRLQYGDQQQFHYGSEGEHFTVTLKLHISRMEKDNTEKKELAIHNHPISIPAPIPPNKNKDATVWLPS